MALTLYGVLNDSPRVGRAPHLDDECAECEFEMAGRVLATQTFAYVIFDKTRRKWVTVHWCPRHQAEVSAVSAGRVTVARSGATFRTSKEIFEKVMNGHGS